MPRFVVYFKVAPFMLLFTKLKVIPVTSVRRLDWRDMSLEAARPARKIQNNPGKALN